MLGCPSVRLVALVAIAKQRLPYVEIIILNIFQFPLNYNLILYKLLL